MLPGELTEKPRKDMSGKPFTTRGGILPFERRILSSAYCRLDSYHSNITLLLIVCVSMNDCIFGWPCLQSSSDLQHSLAQSEGLPSNHCVQSGSRMPTGQIS